MEQNNPSTEGVKRIALVGPECTGKSTLASLLAKYYNTVWVPEYARHYIDRLDRPYEEKDLLIIAKGQIEHEDDLAKKANKLLICDTDLTVIKIWGEHKYGASYDEIIDEYHKRTYDLHLLMGIDMPWHDDPQRENPELRQFFYDLFKKELTERQTNFVEISGEHYQRQNKAIEAINRII